jgi:NAD(P)-dependent dehydrogenase (short-subunit alcohol dehydrogenase family)
MTKITTPFGFKSTADEVLEGVDLSGKTAIATGATSGIGIETARALAKAGAHVALAVRRTDAGQSVAEDIKRSADGASIEVLELDLADQASVRRFVTEWTKPLHILINNAGIMGPAGTGKDRERLGDAVRHKLPRPLLPYSWTSSRAGRRKRRAHRVPQFKRQHVRARVL